MPGPLSRTSTRSAAPLPRERDLDAARARLAELRRVGQQVQQHLDDAVEVGRDRRHPLRQPRPRPGCRAPRTPGSCRPARRRSTSRRSTRAACHSALPDSIFARSSTWLMRRVRRSVSLVMMPRNFLRCSQLDLGVVEQDLGERADRGERRAQLVAHRRDEVVLQPVELLQPLVGRAQLRPSPPRARATSARAGGCRSTACDASSRIARTSSSVSASSLTTEATMTRAEAAPIAPASCDLDEVHELRVGLERSSGQRRPWARGVLGERLVAPPRRRGSARAACRGPAPTRCRARTRAAGLAGRVKTSTNSARLAVLVGARRARRATRRRRRRCWRACSRSSRA